MTGVRTLVPVIGLLGLLATLAMGCAADPPRQKASKAAFGCGDPNPRPGTFCALARVKHSYLFPTPDSTRRIIPSEDHHEN